MSCIGKYLLLAIFKELFRKQPRLLVNYSTFAQHVTKVGQETGNIFHANMLSQIFTATKRTLKYVEEWQQTSLCKDYSKENKNLCLDIVRKSNFLVDFITSNVYLGTGSCLGESISYFTSLGKCCLVFLSRTINADLALPHRWHGFALWQRLCYSDNSFGKHCCFLTNLGTWTENEPL